MAGAALGVGIWMFAVVQQALRLADSPDGWLVALSVGVAGPALGLWLLDRVSARRERARTAERDAGVLEQELLAALAAHGALTSAEAALRTPLTLDEAGSLLEALASMGTVQSVDGPDGRAYGLARAADVGPGAAEGHGHASDGRINEGPALPLSERELDVLALVATGQSDREIAGALTLSDDTVKALAEGVSRKLGARNRTEAIARARSLALV